jgi:hypothetical protein
VTDNKLKNKNGRMKKQLFILTFISITVLLKGQSVQSISPTIPTSPQAESITKHGEFGINYFTGIPDISIPLFEINHHGYKLPISLKYIPQPLKPGYNYDVFGYGWGLSVNSCVSRTIKAIPDEIHDFKIDDQLLSEYYEIYKTNIFKYNWEHDIFNVTLPDGSSFEFIITGKDKSNHLQYTVANGRNVQIQCMYSSDNITSFIITDEDGIKYTFAGADRPYIGAGDYCSSFVSWQLTRIDLPNAPDDPLLFEHNYNILSHQCSVSEAAFFIQHIHNPSPSVGSSSDQYTAKTIADDNYYSYNMSLLSSIQYGSTFINFTFQNGSSATRNYIKDIRIYENNVLNKSINLSLNKYPFYAPGSSTTDSVAQLTTVKTINPQQTDSTETYKCTYLSLDYYFNGLDHWGYLNECDVKYDVGRLNMFVEFNLNTNSVAATKLEKTTQDLCPYYKFQLTRSTNFDNRVPASPYNHCILSTLKYPTGGYSEFTFENNRCLTATDEDGSYLLDKKNRRETIVGGFRIRKITNYTAENVVADTKCFRYGQLLYGSPSDENITLPSYPDEYTGLGEAVVDPNILTYASFTSTSLIPSPVNYMIVGLDPNGIYQSFNNPFSTTSAHSSGFDNILYEWDCKISPSNFRRLLDGRSPVVYPKVTVYHGDIDNDNTDAKNIIGKTVYVYDVYEPFENDTAFFEKPQYYGNTLSYESMKYRYNTLKEKRDYMYTNNSFSLKRKESYTWESATNPVVIDYIFTNPYSLIDNFYSKWITISELFQQKGSNNGINLLSEKLVTTYDGKTNGITTDESYGYNSRNQMNSKVIIDSRGTKIKTNITYPEINSSGTTSDIIQKMVNKNIISPVIESKNIAGDKTVSGAKIDYSEFVVASGKTLIRPARSYTLDITGSIYNFQNEVLKYTANGNPLELVTKDGLHTCYIWGYNDRYIVASIINASYNSSGDIVSGSSIFIKSKINAISGFTGSEADFQNSLNEIRTTLSAAMVTTYTYKPLIGVTIITDPRGVSIYYIYDVFGRLSEVYQISNGVKQKLKGYDYHYRP